MGLPYITCSDLPITVLRILQNYIKTLASSLLKLCAISGTFHIYIVYLESMHVSHPFDV